MRIPRPLSEDQLQGLRDAFAAADRNRDNLITLTELRELQRAFGAAPSESELQDMFSALDLDGDGLIDFGEFVRSIEQTGVATDEQKLTAQLKETFSALDDDGDGFIDAADLTRLLVNFELSEADIAALLAEDPDGDGRVSFRQFEIFARGLELAFVPATLERLTPSKPRS